MQAGDLGPMAGRDHKLTRRAVLGAALAAPVAGVGQDARQATTGWARAVAAMRKAEAELAAFQEQCAGMGDMDDLFGDRLDALYRALRRLLRVPAPDWGALALKVELVVDHEVGTLAGGELCLAALKADARRLALTLR